jgi:putative peptidoglycan lipid II flippase
VSAVGQNPQSGRAAALFARSCAPVFGRPAASRSERAAMTRPTLLRSMLTFSGGTFVSRVLGLVREQAIAYAFGANAATDAFWVAFRIPNFLRRLFAEGSFSVAFVPVFTEVKETRSHEELKQLVARTAGTLGGALLVVTALGVIGAGWVARGFAPGSIDQPVKLALTTDLLRITFPFLLFVSLTALAGGVLNSFHKFALPALTPVILNLCMIAGALWLAPHLGTPIMALGWAIFVAGILQLLVQLPALRALDLLTLPRWGWQHPDVRRIMRLMVPTLFGSSVAQINLLLDTLIASFLISGSQTWLAQTDRLLEFPLGIFGVALGTVILPSLARHHVSTDREGFAKALDWGLRTALLISVPAMLALVLLAKPILATLLQHGRFTAHDVDMAALSLSALSFGLPAFALVKVVAPAFYARQDTKTPVRAGITAMIANMLMNIVFVGILFALWRTPDQAGDGWLAAIAKVPGLHMGLALASALASYLNLAQLWLALRRDGIYVQAGWAAHLLRLGVSCAVMVAVLVACLIAWPDWSAWSASTRVLRLAVVIVAGGGAFVVTLFACGFRLRDLRAH